MLFVFVLAVISFVFVVLQVAMKAISGEKRTATAEEEEEEEEE